MKTCCMKPHALLQYYIPTALIRWKSPGAKYEYVNIFHKFLKTIHYGKAKHCYFYYDGDDTKIYYNQVRRIFVGGGISS